MGPLKENPTGYGGFHTLWAFLSHSSDHDDDGDDDGDHDDGGDDDDNENSHYHHLVCTCKLSSLVGSW